MAGRHRKPKTSKRSAARVLTVAATTLSAVSTTTPIAHSAEADVWDRIAECESNGDWSIDSGNGYSGGLQFAPTTWREFGGSEFAASAASATKSEQIQIATRVQQVQGWEAWPVCSKRAGASGDAPAIGQQGSEEAEISPVPDVSPETTEQSGSIADTVAEGDTLSEIAARHNVSVDELARSSGIVDPDVILPGQRIVLPGSTSPSQSRTNDERSTNAQDNSSASIGDRAVVEARSWFGTDYVWGGESRSGADCSGLVQSVYEDVGVDLPRTANEQMNSTQRISRDELRPGDLLFDVNDSGRATHVGIYSGDDSQIDAPRSGSTVGERSIYDSQTVFGRVS